MTTLRFLILGFACIPFGVGCSGNGDVEAREIPADRPAGVSAEAGPKGGVKSTANDSTTTDAPIE